MIFLPKKIYQNKNNNPTAFITMCREPKLVIRVIKSSRFESRELAKGNVHVSSEQPCSDQDYHKRIEK